MNIVREMESYLSLWTNHTADRISPSIIAIVLPSDKISWGRENAGVLDNTYLVGVKAGGSLARANDDSRSAEAIDVDG
jgi:hypothetical protein